MAISADVLATALQELMPKYSDLFTVWHPVLDRIVTKGNFDRSVLTGPYREFTVVTGGPGTVTQIVTGNELVAGGRTQNALRGNTFAPRLIYAFDVPDKDLAEANGEQDLARILRDYPELGLSDLHERLADQLANGNGTGVGGFLSLNGGTSAVPVTYNPQGAARTGAFLFESIATQLAGGATRFGIPNSTTGWQNQYGAVSSFAVDGRRTMQEVYFRCGRAGSKTNGDVDLILCDEASYLNYIEDLDDQVRVAKIEGDKAPGQVRVGTKFFGADMLLEDSIDTSVTGSNGAMYFMNTNTWSSYTLGHNASIETKGFFDVRGPFRIPDQDAHRYEIVLYMGVYTNQLRSNGCLSGSATP